MDSPRRPLLRRLHLEGIPWPGTVLYNCLSGSGIFLRHYELVADEIASYGRFERLLDVGTGPGRLLFALRNRLPDARLVGIDVSRAMIALALRNLESHGRDPLIEFRVADVHALPFPDETFDCVVSTASLHHWHDPVRALSELHRVLKPNGLALLYDLVRNVPQAVLEEGRAKFGRLRVSLLWLHSFEEPFLSAEDMNALGRQSAFAVDGTKFTGSLCCLRLRKIASPRSASLPVRG